MDEFYSIEENFNYLYNDVYSLLEGVVDSSLAENWLANWYLKNKYNTTRAIEYYAANLIIPKLKDSEIPEDNFKSIINKRLNGCFESYNESEYDINDKFYLVNNIRNTLINESNFSYIIQDFECDEVVSYIKEGYYEGYCNNMNIINNNGILNRLLYIKHDVIDNLDNHERLYQIKECNDILLYKFKNLKYNIHTFHNNELYESLEYILDNENKSNVDYTINELNHINSLIEYVTAPSEKEIYENAVEEFNNLVESIFFKNLNKDIDLDQLTKLYLVTEALCEYEMTMEASSRIITKGTEKVVRNIGDRSAKSRSINPESKVEQIKRGARIADDRASGAINNKIDQILNLTQDAKREKIITGRASIQLSKALKTLIGLIAAGATVKSLPKTTIFKFGKVGLKANLVGLAITIIGIIGYKAISKNVEQREKKRILLELETELRITKEKIEDAKGDNAKEQKYQLMRIEAQLEKEIFRIKHGMKPY